MLTLQKAVIHLSKYEPSSRILIDFQLRSFKLFTRDSTHFSTNNLYVGKVSDLPSPSIFSERINLLLLKDSELPVGFYENQFINYIIIKNQHSMISIINDLQDFFSMREFVSSAIKKLLDALTQDIGIEKMLDISYEILANPLTLTDSTHHLVTHAGWGDELDEPEWQYYLKHGFMSTKFAIAIDNDLEFQRKVTSDRVNPIVIEYEGILNNAQMIGRITSKGTNIAYLAMLDAAKPFSETDYELVPIICDVLSIIMQSQEKLSVATSEIESLVIDILNNSHDQRYISEKINSSQLQPIDELCLVCIGADQALDSTQKMVFVKSLMQYFFVGSTSVVYSGNVLIMIEYKRNHLLFTEGKIADFKQLLVSHNLHAGVSRPFYRLSDIKLHYKQALNAIITARMINHGELLYFYEDYFFHYLVKSFLESNSLHNICLPQLLELIKRDKEKSSSYSISLYRYLQNNGDIKATSRAMHLHYNTMKYRLQKISDVMEVDLKDYDLLLKCKLSFLALEIYHKVNFTDYFEQVRIPEETSYLEQF